MGFTPAERDGDAPARSPPRLMGLILVAISVEMLLRGLKLFAAQLGHP
ncbi:MAG: hypothetical protein Q8R06_00410 [Polaromonas sp.]|nr:hypothetical protein [Polaromonas sp.]MDP3795598.1 hypothetical protein [Polaromonas sp.]